MPPALECTRPDSAATSGIRSGCKRPQQIASAPVSKVLVSGFNFHNRWVHVNLLVDVRHEFSSRQGACMGPIKRSFRKMEPQALDWTHKAAQLLSTF